MEKQGVNINYYEYTLLYIFNRKNYMYKSNKDINKKSQKTTKAISLRLYICLEMYYNVIYIIL